MAGLNTFTLSIILSLVLFVSASTSSAAGKPLTTPTEPHKSVTHSLASSAPPLKKDEEEGVLAGEVEEDDDECSGLEMEECLKRRSMVAHTDYIYTQDINNGP
uniref:Phytosulfokine n=1 Tax=Kalanchoe fedtschenkoi TaxID=63787 RepID=A0A7N0UMQ3_KALFE